MGGKGASHAQSQQGVSGRQILLQTMEDILQALKGKETKQVCSKWGDWGIDDLPNY